MKQHEFFQRYGEVINQANELGFDDEALAFIGGIVAELENLNDIQEDNAHTDPINIEQLLKNALATAKTSME